VLDQQGSKKHIRRKADVSGTEKFLKGYTTGEKKLNLPKLELTKDDDEKNKEIVLNCWDTARRLISDILI